VRIERRMLKVLKGLAEYLDVSLGDLLEGIVLHAFEQKVAFDESTLTVIGRLKEVYGLHRTAADSHQLHSPEEEEDDLVRAGSAQRHHRGRYASRASVQPLHSHR
jgi:hypothetical protein